MNQFESANGEHEHASKLRLKALLGSYPNTDSLKQGEISSNLVTLEFDPSAKPAHAFKRVVGQEFDLAEISVVTYLIARSRGYPLALLPAVMFSRMQHPYILCDARRGRMSPDDLNGKRIGVAYYTTATSTWLRDILEMDYGVDPSGLQWVVQEAPHVPGFEDPCNVSRLAPGADLLALLLSGQIDAMISTPIPDNPHLASVILSPETAARRWFKVHRHLQINHMVVVSDELVTKRPDVVREVWRMLVTSKQTGPRSTSIFGCDSTPYGLDALRTHLDAAIECIHRQGLIPERMPVDALFNEVTSDLRL